MGRQNNAQGLQTIPNYAAKSYALINEEKKKTDIYKSENANHSSEKKSSSLFFLRHSF